MKTLIAITLTTLSLNTFAHDGVTKNFVTFLYGNTEEEVLNEAKILIPTIANATNRKARAEMEKEGCEVKARHISVRGVAVYKTFVGAELQPSYVGRLDYSNTNCAAND